MIVFENVSKRYADKIVLKDFSISFYENKINVLFGKSGIGKTTILNLLMGIDKADSGVINGLAGLKKSSVFQEDRLLESLSVSLNIRLPVLYKDKKEVINEIKDNLAYIGMADYLNKPVSSLSGGMKRRVGILRAIMSDFDVIFFDEPLKGLDKENKDKIMYLINRYIKDKIVFWITHDINDLKYFESYVLFDLDKAGLFN